jgi:hypothetical protein
MTNEVLAFEAAAFSRNYGYHRFESWKLSGVISADDDVICRIYHYDTTSPSGRVLAATLNDHTKAKEILTHAGRI